MYSHPKSARLHNKWNEQQLYQIQELYTVVYWNYLWLIMNIYIIYTLFLIACACFQICYNVFNMFLRLISTFQKTSLSCQHLSILNLYLIYSQYHIVNSRFSEIFPYLYSSYNYHQLKRTANRRKKKQTKINNFREIKMP